MLFFTCNIVLFSITFYCISPLFKIYIQFGICPVIFPRHFQITSSPEIVTSAPSENALWVFLIRISASCLCNHILFSVPPAISDHTERFVRLISLCPDSPARCTASWSFFPANRSRYQICGLPGINIWMARARSIFSSDSPNAL